MGNKKGMTLIEVLISLVLFTMISISLMRMTNSTVQYQKKITKNIKSTKLSRNSLQILKTDIRNIFYIQDVNALIHQSISKKQKDNTTAIRTHDILTTRRTNTHSIQDIALETFNKQQIYPFLFSKIYYSGGIIGKENELYINSFSYVRTTENENMSNHNIIIYYLKPCKNRKTQKTYTHCLWRKSSPLIYQDMENLTNYTEFVLLEDIKTFNLSYYNVSSSEWVSEWKIAYGERNKLPTALKIKLEFKNHKLQHIKKHIVIPIYRSFIVSEEKYI